MAGVAAGKFISTECRNRQTRGPRYPEVLLRRVSLRGEGVSGAPQNEAEELGEAHQYVRKLQTAVVWISGATND